MTKLIEDMAEVISLRSDALNAAEDVFDLVLQSLREPSAGMCAAVNRTFWNLGRETWLTMLDQWVKEQLE